MEQEQAISLQSSQPSLSAAGHGTAAGDTPVSFPVRKPWKNLAPLSPLNDPDEEEPKKAAAASGPGKGGQNAPQDNSWQKASPESSAVHLKPSQDTMPENTKRARTASKCVLPGFMQ